MVAVWDSLVCRNRYRKQLFLQFLPSSSDPTKVHVSPFPVTLEKSLKRGGGRELYYCKINQYLQGSVGEQNVCTGLVRAGVTWEPGSGESHSLSQLSPATAQLNEGLGIQALQGKQNNKKSEKLDFYRTVSDF